MRDVVKSIYRAVYGYPERRNIVRKHEVCLMRAKHRSDSEKRRHFLPEDYHLINLKPRLLYAGILAKESGWAEEAHSHGFLEMVFVADGCGRVFCGENEYEIRRGDLMIYAPGVIHREESSEDDPVELLFLACDRVRINGLSDGCLIPQQYGCLFHGEGMYGILNSCFRQLIGELEGRELLYTEIAQSIFRTLVMYVFRLVDTVHDIAPVLEMNRIIDSATAYIEGNFRGNLTLDSVAEACYTDKYHLSHLFSQVRKMTVWEYILERRITEGKKLLAETGLSVAEVAERSGFRDPGYFGRVFRKATGVNPTAYRRRCREEGIVGI